MLNAGVNYVPDNSAYDVRPMDESMGDRIKTLRSSRRLSQDKLGAELGVSGSAIAQWEKGNTKDLKIANFLRVCAFFNADPQWLAFGDKLPAWMPPAPRRSSGTK